MRFEKCNMPQVRGKYGSMQRFVEDFLNSGLACAKIVDIGNRSLKALPPQVNRAAKKLNVPHINAFVFNGEAYIKNDIILNGGSDGTT